MKMHESRVGCLAVVLLGFSSVLLGEIPAQKAPVQLSIPSQSLSASLADFARQTGMSLIFKSELGERFRAPALSGQYRPDEALKLLLAGSQLTYRFVDEKTISIKRGTEVSKSENGMRLAQEESAVASDPNIPSSTEGSSAQESDQNAKKREPGIQEIMVTATKRSERLQDVPISIAVVTADDIDRRGFVSSGDYLRGIPGVNQTEPSLYGQSIQIRGIETRTLDQNSFAGPTTATYVGETPTTTAAGIAGGTTVDVKLVDIERVEVLRGPQGTAFGSSSLGGAVRTIPVAPKLDRVEGKVGAGYSATSDTGGDNYDFQAVGNFPLIQEKLALRATAYRYEQSGFYRNVAGSDTAWQAAIAPFGAQAFAIDEQEVGTSRFTGGRIAALFQASDNLKFTLSYLTQKTETDGLSGAMIGGFEQTNLQVAPEHSIRGQTGMVNDTDINIANAVMEYDFGWANLLGTYSHINSGTERALPLSVFTAPLPLSIGADSDHRSHVGELRLATQFDGAWNFLAGLYAEELKDDLLFTYSWHGDPAANFFALGQRDLGFFRDKQSLTQEAAFGEVSWELLQGLTLIGGVRAYEYHRTRQNDTAGALLGASSADPANTASGENFRVNLSYNLTDGALVYGGWSQGFRLGQVQPGLPPGVCDVNDDGLIDGTSRSLESTRRLESDTVDSYEVGAKLALLDRRVTIDAAIFRMDWSEVPVTVFLSEADGVSANCAPFSTHAANAGDARSEGVEIQANLQVTDAFRVDVGGSWIDARLMNDVPGLGAVAGDRLPGTPEYNANLGLQYELAIAGQRPSVRADATYIGSYPSDLAQRIGSAGNYVKVDASVRFPIRRANVDLFVRNLTNEDAFISGGGLGFSPRLRPRTVGLQLTYNFGN